MPDDEGKFTILKVTPFKELVEGRVKELEESDLCFQTDSELLQFKYVESEGEPKKYEIKPGFHTLVQTNSGLATAKVEFRKRELLEDITSTAAIFKEARTFFSKLHIYEKLGRQKKRGVLLYSAPGCGKSSSIERFCADAVVEDPGTVVLMWPTSQIEADNVLRFLSVRAAYVAACTRVILIIEDIGGKEPGEDRAPHGVDSGLLNLLDGIGVTFKLPTFVVATTNHPEQLLQSLADRPGRFDLLLKLNPPTHDEKIRLMAFIAKRDLSDEEKNCLGRKGTEDFSIAHLEEIAIRSLLHDKTYPQVVEELIDHSRRFKKFFEEGGSVGFREKD